MEPLHSTAIETPWGEKTIEVYAGNILSFPQPIDVMTISAFKGGYQPTAGTLLHALQLAGIPVSTLAHTPAMDLRQQANVWLSAPTDTHRIARVGCIEIEHSYHSDGGFGTFAPDEHKMLRSFRAYFQMLDIAATCGIPVQTVSVPLPGGGNQNIAAELTLVPILKECIDFLRRCSTVRRIVFVERDPAKAYTIRYALRTSYLLQQNRSPDRTASGDGGRSAKVFLSYNSADSTAVTLLCRKLEQRGLKVWYAPRDVRGDYPSAIVQAIGESTHYVVLLSRSSMQSQHVLNEVDLAFQKLPDRIRFYPLRIDNTPLTPAFSYYLARQNWIPGWDVPLEQSLEALAARIDAEAAPRSPARP